MSLLFKPRPLVSTHSPPTHTPADPSNARGWFTSDIFSPHLVCSLTVFTPHLPAATAPKARAKVNPRVVQRQCGAVVSMPRAGRAQVQLSAQQQSSQSRGLPSRTGLIQARFAAAPERKSPKTTLRSSQRGEERICARSLNGTAPNQSSKPFPQNTTEESAAKTSPTREHLR